MEFKGTKGKWEINRWGNVRSENGTEVAYMPSLTVKEQKEANALLISKSPEILEMLKELLSHYEDVVKGDYSPFALRSDIDKAKQLIKEATTI